MTDTRIAPVEGIATATIQSAIDESHAAGGGRVILASGAVYTSGTLVLRSGVELHLAHGAVLKGSPDRADYVDATIAGLYGGNAGAFLITADGAEDVAITGSGRIDGNADPFFDGWGTDDGPYIRAPKCWRPRGLGLFGCRRVRIQDVSVGNLAQWTLHLTGCEDVLVQGITIKNGLDVPNCDGIDPDHCRNVRIIGCHIEAGDDGIVLKNTREHTRYGPCENIVVQGCTVVSTSAAIKIGTESSGLFRDVVIADCVIKASHRGLAIQLRDDGNVENVLFSNCIVETRLFCPRYWGRAEPIYVTAWPRHDGDGVGSIRHVRFTNILCRGEHGVFVHGHPDSPVEDIAFTGVRHELAKTSRWPAGQHDLRPSRGEEHGGLRDDTIAGFHLEHVTGARLTNCAVAWSGELPECYGPALQTRNVEDLVVDGFTGEAAHGGEAQVRG